MYIRFINLISISFDSTPAFEIFHIIECTFGERKEQM